MPRLEESSSTRFAVPYEAFDEGTHEEKDLETAALRGFPNIAFDLFSGRLLLAPAYRPLLWRRLSGSHGRPKRTVQEGPGPTTSTRKRSEQRFTTCPACAKRRQLL